MGKTLAQLCVYNAESSYGYWVKNEKNKTQLIVLGEYSVEYNNYSFCLSSWAIFVTQTCFAFESGYSSQFSGFQTLISRENYLHIVYIDLEKSYNKVPREVLWWTLVKKSLIKYINIIKNKDMYDRVVNIE